MASKKFYELASSYKIAGNRLRLYFTLLLASILFVLQSYSLHAYLATLDSNSLNIDLYLYLRSQGLSLYGKTIFSCIWCKLGHSLNSILNVKTVEKISFSIIPLWRRATMLWMNRFAKENLFWYSAMWSTIIWITEI